MDGRGRARDNIFVERLWRTVKYEEIYLKDYTDGPAVNTGQAAQKRAEYQFPESLTLIAEYWTAEDSPAVISVFEADDAAPLLENSLSWADYFETTEVLPVVTAEEGLERFTGGS